MMASEMRKSALMAIDEINRSDDFDFTFAPHLRDPGGVVAAYHTACDDLIREEQVHHIVGCYTSASRKQVIPIVERTERLLWAVMLGDLLSLHVAAERGVDPVQIDVLERLKDELGRPEMVDS